MELYFRHSAYVGEGRLIKLISPVVRENLNAGDEITVIGLYAVVVSDNGDSLTLDLGTDKVRVTVLKEHLKYEDR